MFKSIRLTLLLVIALILTAISSAQAQPLRILMVETMPVPVVLQHEDYFLEGMKKLGYKPGDNIILDSIKAEGDKIRAKTELENYIKKHRPDIVVSFATLASQAANEILAGTNIPLVFCVVAGPVKAGLIKEVGQPTNTNVTGLIYTLLRQSKMDLAKALLTQQHPDRPTRIGIILSSYPSSVDDANKMKNLAENNGQLEFFLHQLDYRPMPDGLDDMLADAKKGIDQLSAQIDYWWIVPGPLGETKEFTELLLESGVPVGLCHTPDCIKKGGLFYVNPSYKESGYQVASIVDSILKGTPPGTIPPVPPDNFDFGINLSTAIELGIVVPSEYLELAGDNVWR